jgi:hypothetical protein
VAFFHKRLSLVIGWDGNAQIDHRGQCIVPQRLSNDIVLTCRPSMASHHVNVVIGNSYRRAGAASAAIPSIARAATWDNLLMSENAAPKPVAQNGATDVADKTKRE